MADTKISGASRLTGTGKVTAPVALAGSTTAFHLQNNFEATTDPAVGNDDSDGYSIGSVWFRKDTQEIFMCRSVATGAAVWNKLGAARTNKYVAGRWYLPIDTATTASTLAPGAGSIRLYPFTVPHRVTVSDLGVRVVGTQAAQNVQAAIYASDTNDLPTGNALSSTASMSTASAATVTAALGANVTLEPGRVYWAATNCSHATPTFINFTQSGSVRQLHGSTTAANILGNSGGNVQALEGLSFAQTFNTWPDLTGQTFTEVINTTNVPAVIFKVASVP